MRTLTLAFSITQNRFAGRLRKGATALLIAGALFLLVQSQSRAADLGAEIYLGSAQTGYTDVTAYVQVDGEGNDWVVGWDGLAPFEIVVDLSGGHVLDPTGKVIGVCEPAE